MMMLLSGSRLLCLSHVCCVFVYVLFACLHLLLCVVDCAIVVIVVVVVVQHAHLRSRCYAQQLIPTNITQHKIPHLLGG